MGRRGWVVAVAVAVVFIGACSSDDDPDEGALKEPCARIEEVYKRYDVSRTLSEPVDTYAEELGDIADDLKGDADALEDDLRLAVRGMTDQAGRKGDTSLAIARLQHGLSGLVITCAEAGTPVDFTGG